MEQTKQANPPEPTGTPEPTQTAHQEHWLIQTTGGLTLANTMVAGLSMFYLWMAYVVIPTA